MKAGPRTRRNVMIIACVLAVLVVLTLIRDFAIRQAIIVYGGRLTGTALKLDSFSLSLLRQSVRIRGFALHQPAGFENGMLIDVPRVSLDVDGWALLKGKVHIQSAHVIMKEMVLIRNREGRLNVDSLKIAQKKPAPDKEQPRGEQRPQKKLPLQIDVLTIGLGKVVMKDYTKGDEPRVTVYELGNREKTYKGVTSAEQLALLIMIEPMKNAGIAGAAIYGVTALAGIAFLPAAAVVTVAGKDSSQQEFLARVDRVYAEALALAQATGKVKSEDKAAGMIKASYQGTDLTITIQKKDRKTLVTVAARKFMVPKPAEANGFLYQLADRLHEK